jgi:hypothetical protein
VSSKPIRHSSTSADPDHTGGNERVSSAGTYVRLLDTSILGANKNVDHRARQRAPAHERSERHARQLTPAGSWPSDTAFTNDWLFVNDEADEPAHSRRAHGRRHDGVLPALRRDHTGDIFTTTGYPRFDPEHGGSVTGILDGLNRILEIAIPGENQTGGTAIVPAHHTGRVRCRDLSRVEGSEG